MAEPGQADGGPALIPGTVADGDQGTDALLLDASGMAGEMQRSLSGHNMKPSGPRKGLRAPQRAGEDFKPLSGTHPLYPIKNLAMEGGGARGLAYNGAIKALEAMGKGEGADGPDPEQQGVLAYISRFAGASAGSLVALQLALGYTPDEIAEMAETTNMDKEMRDGPCGWCCCAPSGLNLCCGLLKVFSCTYLHLNKCCCRERPLGLNPGKRLERFIGKCIEKQTGCPDTTFKELWELTGVELCVVVCNFTSMTTEEWHVKTTPNKTLRDAVRASMGLPFFCECILQLGRP